MKAGGAVLCLLICLRIGAAEAAEGDPPGSVGIAVAGLPDPRLQRSSEAGQALRQLGDAVFTRPFYLARLVAGLALLPVALPTAAVFADWRDALDLCATGPFEMLFQRPLGE